MRLHHLAVSATAGLALCLLPANALAESVPPPSFEPYTGSPAPGAYDGLTARQRAAVRWNLVAPRNEIAGFTHADEVTEGFQDAKELGERVWRAEQRVSPAEFKPSRWNTLQYRVRQWGKGLPRLLPDGRTVAKIGGRAGAVGTTFGIGIEIGTGIRKLFGIAEAPPEPPYASYTESVWEWTSSGGNMGAGAVVPGQSWFWRWRKPGANLDTAFDIGYASWASSACHWYLREGPAFARIAVGTSSFCGAPDPSRVAYVTPEDLRFVLGLSTTKPSGYPTDPAFTLPLNLPLEPTLADIDAALRQLFDSPEGEFTRQVWDWIFREYAPAGPDGRLAVPDEELDLGSDGSPMARRIKIRSGLGTPRQEYLDYLVSEGLSYAVETRFDWNRDYDPDDVVFTDPSGGTSVARGTTVRVVVNPSSIPAPSRRTGETASELAARAYKIGWAPVVTYADDPALSEDAVVREPSPAPGTRSAPGSRLDIDAANAPSRGRHNPDCEVPNEPPDPGAAEAAEVDFASVILTFTALGEVGGTVPLRGGKVWENLGAKDLSGRTFTDWTGWGWKHIKAKHGWGPVSATLTQRALDTVPVPGSTGRYEYRTPFVSSRGKLCVWVVVVDRTPIAELNEHVEGPFGIWTAYGSTP